MRIRTTRWLTGALAAALVAVVGVAVYARASADHSGNLRAVGSEDQLGREAAVDGDEEEEAGEEAAVADPSARGSGPQSFTVRGHSAFVDTRKLTAKPDRKRTPRKEAELRDAAVHTAGAAGVIQSAQAAALAAPAPAVNVLGLDFNNWGDGHPPDTNGVIGPNHFVQTVNTSVGIFSKSTGARLSALKMRVKRACDALRVRLTEVDGV